MSTGGCVATLLVHRAEPHDDAGRMPLFLAQRRIKPERPNPCSWNVWKGTASKSPGSEGLPHSSAIVARGAGIKNVRQRRSLRQVLLYEVTHENRLSQRQ